MNNQSRRDRQRINLQVMENSTTATDQDTGAYIRTSSIELQQKILESLNQQHIPLGRVLHTLVPITPAFQSLLSQKGQPMRTKPDAKKRSKLGQTKTSPQESDSGERSKNNDSPSS